MLLTEIDHVAIAVRDLEAAIDYYGRAFGAPSSTARWSRATASEEALLKVAEESHIRLLHPDHRARRPWPRRSRSVVRACTTSVPGASGLRRGAGRRWSPPAPPSIDKAPRTGKSRTTVALIHPKGSFGTLIELVQE